MLDLRLYIILDKGIAGSRSLEAITEAAIAGGAAIVQYRDKISNTKSFTETAKKLQVITKKANIPFIINDRVDVALAIGAEGVHLGQDDMPVGKTREMLKRVQHDKERFIIGVSAKTVTEAKKAEQDGADYIGAGAVFGTKSKLDAGLPIGIDGLAKIVESVSIPVVAIGGINAKNAKEVLETGAKGIAVISAVLNAKDPERVTRELRDKISNF